MNNNVQEHLDSIESNHLQNSASLFDRVSQLENVVHNQACRLFGLASRKQKKLGRFNRRTQQSISLVKEKNMLMKQIETFSVIIAKNSLRTLLDNVSSRFRNLHCGETSGKKCWKIKQANQAVLRNPHKAGKSVLDSKCEICLKCEKRTLDDFKTKFLSDFLYDATLSHLRGLPSVFCLLLKQKICLLIYAQFG